MYLIGTVCILLIFFYLLKPVSELTLDGESRVSQKLKALEKRNGSYRVINDVILGTPDGSTQIDHVVISVFGIFVIETKDLKGWIFGSGRQRRWTQSLYKRQRGLYRHYTSEKYQFQNPLHQNYKHIKAIQKYLDLGDKYLYSVIVFTGDSEFKTELPENVIEEHQLLDYIKNYSARILSPDRVEILSNKLIAADHKGDISLGDHIQNLEENLVHPMCPKCGKKMVLRTARKGSNIGGQFWGCSSFPYCKITRAIVKSNL